MSKHGGNGESGNKSSPPITEQFGADTLQVADNLWTMILQQEKYLDELIPRQTEENLKRTHRWLRMASKERAEDPAFKSIQDRAHISMKAIAESSAKVAEYFIMQAMRKELRPKELVEDKIRDLREHFSKHMHLVVAQNLDDMLTQNPVIFLEQEIVVLAESIRKMSKITTWKHIAEYLRNVGTTDPNLELVRLTYEDSFKSFLRGYEIQAEKKKRHEAQGK